MALGPAPLPPPVTTLDEPVVLPAARLIPDDASPVPKVIFFEPPGAENKRGHKKVFILVDFFHMESCCQAQQHLFSCFFEVRLNSEEEPPTSSPS